MANLAACTIITKSYLAYARTLALSLKEHNPDSTLYVLLADKLDNYFDPKNEPFELIQLQDLSDSTAVENMCFYYTPFELCCALRGMLHEYMYENVNADKWLFIDSDILICHSLEAIYQQLETVSILLCPHSTTPVSEEFAKHYEIAILQHGLYNGGFLGLRRTEETKRFISWFKQRLSIFGFHNPTKGQYVDQLWLNLVPLMFQEVGLLLLPGANLAYWNLYERIVEENDEGQITVNKEPLLFFHFSRWNLSEPTCITAVDPKIADDPMLMYKEKEFSCLSELGQRYRDQLFSNGYEITKDYPYAFARFSNGTLIKPFMRRIYFDELLSKGLIPYKESPFSNHTKLVPNLRIRKLEVFFRSMITSLTKRFGRPLFGLKSTGNC